jgi:hypothetical protein
MGSRRRFIEVSDAGTDSPATIAEFLFKILVSDASVMEAFDLLTEADGERDLSLDLSSAFADLSLLAEGPTLHVRHPIEKKAPITGAHAVHEPSFSQKTESSTSWRLSTLTPRNPSCSESRRLHGVHV